MSATGTAGPRARDLPHQFPSLLRLRWRMVRSRRQRALLVGLAFVPIFLIVVSIAGFRQLPPDQAFNLLLVTPTVYLAFVGLTILVPLTAGGGYELYPAEQLLAYPLRARTYFVSTLALVPANLAWALNVIALVVLTTATAGPVTWRTSALISSVLVFVAMATTCGHALGWAIVGVRQTRRGRWATWILAGLVGVVVLVIVRTGDVFPLLDAAPTRYALLNALQGYTGHWLAWAVGVLVMVGITAMAVLLGVRATAWALRRPGDGAVFDSARAVRRRRPARSPLRVLLATDRASVWRAPALRRGLLVLVVLPGAVAVIAGLSWQSLVLLPGLVAAGAALLFGVNAFALDAGGTVWLTTLPHWAGLAFVSKVWVMSEVTALSVGIALLGGSLRAPSPVVASQVTATISCGLAAGLVVVASAIRSSVHRPHRATLLGPRDTPAPPGAMVGYSLKLATICTFTGLLFSGVALVGTWWLPFVAVVPFAAWAVASIRETAREWSRPGERARVVTTVAAG